MAREDPPKKDFVVGYGKPPVQHRFKKGASGNPRGRPKGKKKSRSPDLGFGLKAAEQFLREEAYRPIALREGDAVIELPAIQAVFRAMGVSALKGNRFAQRTLAELVTRMEDEDHRARMELFGSAVEYKHQWSEVIDQHVKAGIEPPRPIPHPEDIILDPANGAVRFEGPQTKEQRDRLEVAIQRRSVAQDDVNFYAEKYRRARDPKLKARWLEEWHWEQRMFDIINDIVPRRYKTKLENRSYREGASSEGTALEQLRRDRRLRDEYCG